MKRRLRAGIVYAGSVFALACTPAKRTLVHADAAIQHSTPALDPERLDALEQTSSPIVLGHTHILSSQVWGGMREINVYLPPEFDASKSYPILYVLDGGAEQDFFAMVGLVRNLSMNGQADNWIVVGLKSEQRQHEMTPSTSSRRDRRWLENPGGAETNRKWIRDEVIPFVEHKYARASKRGLIGESLAGLFIVDSALEWGELFQAYFAISPSLWYNHGQIAKTANTRLACSISHRYSIYFSVADEGGEMEAGVRTLHDSFKNLGAHAPTWHFSNRADETHATTYLSSAARGLRWAFKSSVEHKS